MEKIIEVENLIKTYGEVRAVNDISFYVEKGKLFSFLGPNGAGKSTTIDILCTLLSFDSGTVKIGGLDITRESAKVRKKMGVVYQDNMLDSLLTVRENLVLRAGFYYKTKSDIAQAVQNSVRTTELAEFIDRPYGKLSGGQRRRADIARALINSPELLFLDEPTTGLDPQTRQSVWESIEKLKGELGMTVFLTTHYMEEAAKSDYVVVIDHGRIAAKGTPGELKARYSSDCIKLAAKDRMHLVAALDALKLDYNERAGVFTIKTQGTLAALQILEKCKDHISGFEVQNGTMDDAFIGITGKELRE